MKTAYSLKFKRIGTITLIRDNLTWIWDWKLSKVKSRAYETYKNKEVKKEQKDETKADEETEEER